MAKPPMGMPPPKFGPGGPGGPGGMGGPPMGQPQMMGGPPMGGYGGPPGGMNQNTNNVNIRM